MIRTVHIGLGTIGREIVKAAVLSGKAHPVAAVDPLFAGQSLGQVPDVPDVKARVFHDLSEALEASPQVAVISTFSKVEAIAEDLHRLIAAGVNVVSTCENLSYPWLTTPELADELDQAARDAGVTVVGTGVNPGFVLDCLPVMLSRPCATVRRVLATRVVDTSLRRKQLQLKTGAGMMPEDFESKAQAGLLGHVGLAESACLIARGLGWKVDHKNLEEDIAPVINDRRVQTEHVLSEPHQAKGQLQHVVVRGEQGREIRLTLKMELGAAEEYDEIIIEGEPKVTARIIGGVFGDSATAGCTVNIIRQALNAPPGLLTVLDMPLM
jgi:4-hydroxy-tetrahydrodipicolinate reductase